MDSILEDVKRLLFLGVGDTARLQHIEDSLNNNRTVYMSDRKYVEDLIIKHFSKNDTFESTQETATDNVSEDPEKNNFEFTENQEHITNENNQLGDTTNESITGNIVYRGANRYKSEGTTLCLSLFIGFLGFFGLGQRYVGNTLRSLGLLYLGWFLLSATLVAIIPFLFGLVPALFHLQTANNYGYYSNPLLQMLAYQSGTTQIIILALMVITPITFFAVLIWQAFDARNLCRKYNKHMDESGKELFVLTRQNKINYFFVATAPITVSVALFAIMIIKQSFHL